MSASEPRSTPSSVIPQKRSLPEDGASPALLSAAQDHIPAVSSPLNPDASPAGSGPAAASTNRTAANAKATSTAPVTASGREPREKKDSLKKREANELAMSKAGNAGRLSVGKAGAGPASGAQSSADVAEGGSSGSSAWANGNAANGAPGEGKEKGKKGGSGASRKQQATASPLPLLRYHIPRPKAHDFEKPTPPVPVPAMVVAGKQYYETTEHVFNRKGFRYIHSIADPGFPSIQYHRQSETEPFYTRFDFSDSSQHINLDQTARCVTTEKGFRMARANVCAREGRWYWECKVLSGIKQPGDGAGGNNNGHVRLGFSRREASLETPVGFDAYSYGIRDASGQKVHMSRPKDFMTGGDEIREGDVIGFEINLPGLGLHRKVVEGSYNKAVDVSYDPDPVEAGAQDIIRDRLPIRYKSHLYFESFEYQSVKELEDLMNPSPVVSTGGADKSGMNKAPYPNHPSVSMRTLPNSSIKVYKNGTLIGTPFKDLLAFLPPASKPAGGAGQVAAREGLDDGMLGYFPSVSVFRGGAVEANFGPSFWFPPPEYVDDGDTEMGGTGPHATGKGSAERPTRLRPMAERFDEQIAEDIVYDIIDEVDLWSTDSSGKTDASKLAKAPPLPGPVDLAISGDMEDSAGGAGVAGGPGAEEIKEIVQDDEE